MLLNLLYELKKCEHISYADPFKLKSGGTRPPSSPTDRRPCCVELPNPTFWQKNCHHSNGNKLHKVQESAASAVGDKHQAGEG